MFFIEPIPQDQGYHNFADRESAWGVSNFMNVISNAGFLFVGVYGFVLLSKYKPQRASRMIYSVLFAGIILTGLGSAYYHSLPGNTRLVWDRLPMTIVFMSFLCATIAERISQRAGLLLLFPLLLTGIASVWWWHFTEMAGYGDLRFYALVQFYPMVFIPFIIMLFPAKHKDFGAKYLWWVVISYAIAKLFERYDKEIFISTGIISGHSLKHLAATAATLFIAVMFAKRYKRSTYVQ